MITPRESTPLIWVLLLAIAAVSGLTKPPGALGNQTGGASSPYLTGSVNVRDAPYSAVADGKTDDTRAIQAALDHVAATGGGSVFLPPGNYFIAGHLVVAGGTSLVGVGRAPAMYSMRFPGSTLLAVEGAGDRTGTPFITLLGPNSTLEGITILYPKQVVGDSPVPYPWTVRGGGSGGLNVSILNVLLVNPYQAVDFGTYPSARHFVRGLYGQPLFKGIWVDRSQDVGRIQDVHFWPFWSLDKGVLAFTTTKGTAFIFQRTDWEIVESIFCWGYHVGIEFSASRHGAMNGQMTNVNLDNVDVGLDVRDTQPYAVHVSNLNIANDGAGTEHVAIWGRPTAGAAELSVRGASFWGSLKQTVRWEAPGTLSLADARLIPWDPQQPMIELLAGRALIHDNSFQVKPAAKLPGVRRYDAPPSNGNVTAIRIGPGVDRVIVRGNQLNGSRIVNDAPPKTVLAENQP